MSIRLILKKDSETAMHSEPFLCGASKSSKENNAAATLLIVCMGKTHDVHTKICYLKTAYKICFNKLVPLLSFNMYRREAVVSAKRSFPRKF